MQSIDDLANRIVTFTLNGWTPDRIWREMQTKHGVSEQGLQFGFALAASKIRDSAGRDLAEADALAERSPVVDVR